MKIPVSVAESSDRRFHRNAEPLNHQIHGFRLRLKHEYDLPALTTPAAATYVSKADGRIGPTHRAKVVRATSWLCEAKHGAGIESTDITPAASTRSLGSTHLTGYDPYSSNRYSVNDVEPMSLLSLCKRESLDTMPPAEDKKPVLRETQKLATQEMVLNAALKIFAERV